MFYFILLSVVAASNTTTWSLVTDYTTYCPESTEITVNDEVVTITGPTTLTLTGECTLDYVATVEAVPSSVADVSVIESNGAKRLGMGCAAVAGVLVALI